MKQPTIRPINQSTNQASNHSIPQPINQASNNPCHVHYAVPVHFCLFLSRFQFIVLVLVLARSFPFFVFVLLFLSLASFLSRFLDLFRLRCLSRFLFSFRFLFLLPVARRAAAARVGTWPRRMQCSTYNVLPRMHK